MHPVVVEAIKGQARLPSISPSSPEDATGANQHFLHVKGIDRAPSSVSLRILDRASRRKSNYSWQEQPFLGSPRDKLGLQRWLLCSAVV